MTRLLWTVDKRLIGVVLFLVVSPLLGTVYTYTRGGESTRVYAATASTLNFQARLMASNGALVADGSYSIEFKLYTAVTGGSNEWTATQAVTVKNGYFNTQLGSAPSPFPGTIDWSQEKWLTMNINGDGEMTPRIKLTAVPYAFRSGQADSLSITGGTITGDNLLQKAPGSVQSLSSANAGLRFNQTGAGGLIQLQTGGLDAFTVNNLGAITAATSTNTINGLVINAGALSSVTGITFTSGNLALGGGNITGAGSIAAGNGALNIDTLGNITTAFTLLNGSSTTNGTSGIGGASSTSMVLTSATNFDIGNYVRLANANCGGAGVNVCYAKITNKVTNTLTISPALVWANGSAVTEYRVPELGGTNGSQPLQNRFGRGYFISGIATGNGTTFYNEDSISTSLNSFSIADENVETLRIGGQAGDISIGNASTTVSLLGSLTTSLTETITAGGGLIVSSGGASITGGANLNSGGITNAGAISGIAGLTLSSGDIALGGGNITGAASITGSSLSVTGAITAATSSDTINGLVISGGALSNITGITFTSGGLNVNNGGITNAGAISGIAGLTLSSGNLTLGGGNITGAGSIAGTSLGLSGAITGATATNTINGLIINAGNLSGITGLSFTSGSLNLNNGGIINAGSVIGITGITFTSGNLLLGNGNITGVNGLTATTVTTGTVTNAGILSLNATGAGNNITATAANQIQLNAGTTIELQDTTNITGNLGITGSITNTTAIKFNTASPNPTYAEGLLFYDNTQKALSYYNSEAEVTMNLGQEQFIYVYNNTGATIADRQAVYISGANAGTPTVALARADVFATAQAVGVSTHAIENNTYGFITRFGEINNVNTSTFAAGDTLYLSATTAGLLTNVMPVQPNFTNPLGRVTEVNATTGKIFVLPGDTRFGAMTTGSVAFGGTDGFIHQDSTNFFWDDVNKRLGIGDTTPAATLTVGAGDLFQVAGATGNVTTSGALTIAGLATFNGSISLQTGDSLTVNGDAFTDFTGAGLIRSAGSVLNIDVATAGTVAGTNSNSGLITAADGLSLLRGCANNQILKWGTGGGGLWSCAADNTGVSDQRLKKNIESVQGSMLSRIKDVNLYSFDYDCTNAAFQAMHCDTDHQVAGVMAQELKELFPELVIEVNGFYQVRYDALSLYNLKAVGELAQQVDQLALSTRDSVTTGGILRLNSSGTLQNINGLNLTSGGASIVGGLNNNNGGITNVGILSGITNISAQSINLAATADQNLLTFTKDGTGVFTVFNSGALQLMLDDTQALGVKSANGNSVLNVDTLTGRVKIGAGVDSKTVLFVLDSKSTDGDPAGVNGAQYYNAKSNKFRCYQNNKWQDCLQTAYSEYSIMTQRQAWAQPSGDHELPGEKRTWIDLSNANQIRTLINMPVAAANNASCKLQFSLTEDTPNWQDIAATGKIATDKTGSLKSDWLQIKDEAKKEVLVRTYCSGGDGVATPEIAAIRAQVR